jgi:small subunit ribosomal protein S4
MKGVTGESLLQLLECRLDNVVFRLGFSVSRAQARQIVRHRHILVNGRVCDIPSYQVKVGETISIKEKSKNLEIITSAIKTNQRKEMLSWLSFNPSDLSGTLLQVPLREAIPLPVNEQMVVELYSK